jgi:hypothetical protein
MGLTPCEEKQPVFDSKDAEISKQIMRRNDRMRRKKEISVT